MATKPVAGFAGLDLETTSNELSAAPRSGGVERGRIALKLNKAFFCYFEYLCSLHFFSVPSVFSFLKSAVS